MALPRQVVNMDSDKTPFLQNDDSEYGDDYRTNRAKTRSTWRLFHIILGALNILLFLGLVLLYAKQNVSLQGLELEEVFSAESAIQYQYQKVDTHDQQDPFTGQPGREVDEAWSDLLKSSTIRITQDELDSMNRTSIPLQHGDGYLAYLETYHMLHCVKRIYQFQYPENYPDVIATGELTLAHWEHCLQVLRKGIMCNAGPSVNTYVRNAETGKLKGDSTAPRKCVNWSVFEAWADERAVSRKDYIESGLGVV